MDRWLDGLTDRWTDRQMDSWLDGGTDRRTKSAPSQPNWDPCSLCFPKFIFNIGLVHWWGHKRPTKLKHKMNIIQNYFSTSCEQALHTQTNLSFRISHGIIWYQTSWARQADMSVLCVRLHEFWKVQFPMLPIRSLMYEFALMRFVGKYLFQKPI